MIDDPCLQLLANQLAKQTGKKLWFADEHHGTIFDALIPHKDSTLVLSNRYDVAQHAKSLGLNTLFNDWALPSDTRIKTAFLRVCKEKSVTTHLILQAFTCLEENGELILVGQKNEGIKSYEKIASSIFTGNSKSKHLKKLNNNYIATFSKITHAHHEYKDEYHNLSEIAQWQGQTIFSKPGVYGWNKIDQGSATLIEHLDSIIDNRGKAIESILDLGCGYGFLTMASAHIPCHRRVATDNNAGALLCTKHNAHVNEIEVAVIAGDCGDSIHEKFDLILCNPPFHKGFDVDSSLTDQFLKASKNKLNKNGIAVFVVNSFIPLEKKLAKYFSSAEQIVNTGQFKVFALML